PSGERAAVGVGEVGQDLRGVGGPPRLPQHAAQRRRRRQTVVLAAAPLEPAVAVAQPDRRLLEPHGRRHARRQVVRDAAEIELSRDRLAHLEERGLVVELLAEEELVERRLEPAAEDLEERDSDEEEAEVEERRRRELGAREGEIRQGHDEGVQAEENRRRRGVEERAPDDDAHVEHLEPDDRVGERQRDQDHRDDPVEGVLVDAERRRQDDEEEDERDRPDDRADEDVEGLPPLARLLEREGRMRQGDEAEDEVVPEKDPGGQRRAREDRHLLPADLAQDVVEEDERRNRVEQIQQLRARREEALERDLPARGRLPRPLVRLREVQPLRSREDEEEVE